MKYIIRIFADYANSRAMKNIYEEICEVDKLDYYGPDKEIYITDEDNYTHAIVINNAKPFLRVPKENVVGLANEPPFFLSVLFNANHFINYASKYIGKYFVGDIGLPAPFVCRYSFLPHITPLKYKPNKNKLMSIIVSEKSLLVNAVGYNYRKDILSYILNSDLPIDIYGRICKFITNQNDERIKGEFQAYEPYENYQFHICIENFRCESYVSEKVINPLILNTVPIYLGCTKIEEHFGDNVIQMSGDLNRDLELICDILNYPEKYQKNIDLEFIKSKTSLIQNIKEIFS